MKNTRIFDFGNGLRYDLIQDLDLFANKDTPIKPYDYQQEILDKLEAERIIQNSYKNLVVSATGTGKTIISAFDYKRFKENNPEHCRLLFIAHRKEILEQSINVFRRVLADANFGELSVGEYQAKSKDFLFCSIQSFNSQSLANKVSPDYYDFIIVDEFHHACADSYQKLLSYFTPRILLGLTGTPERMDGKDILAYFNGRIASEIRLPDAIHQGLLVPFKYYMIADTVNLSNVAWENGGYRVSELTKLFATDKYSAETRASNIIDSTKKYITNLDNTKGLGFCVSIEHAKFMSEYFNKKGISSVALYSSSPKEIRSKAQEELISGKIKFIFVVDLYNEGVDIPEVNTVLFLRPTESLTVYLQQLGRGLRLAHNKEYLTVLDFIAQAHKNFDFESRLKALQYHKKNRIEDEITMRFDSLPQGCDIKLDRKATEYILENIKKYFNTRGDLVAAIKYFTRDTGLPLNLTNFLNYYRLTPADIYSKGQIFARLCVEAGVKPDFDDEYEKETLLALEKLSFANSRRFINFLMYALNTVGNWEWTNFNDLERKMINMFTVTLWSESSFGQWSQDGGRIFANLLCNRPVIKEEILDLLNYQATHIDFIDAKADLGYETPLDVYCNYTRDQLLVAFDYMQPASFVAGVKWLEEYKTDLFLITLDKSDKQFSETTKYEDYAIDCNTFHWQTQNSTGTSSPTCKRYINHKALNSKVILFVRERKFADKLNLRAPYTFIGSAEYQSHNGNKPVNFTWHLIKPLPAKFLRMTQQLINVNAA